MSTTFTVFPGNSYIPSFNEVLELTNIQLHRYLLSAGIQKQVNIIAELHNVDEHRIIDFNLSDEIVWNEKTYAWFFVKGIPGGTDVYFYKNNELDFEIWEDEIRLNPNATKMQKLIRSNLEIGYHWSFRRSAGQPAIIALSYGLLAASVAKLTEGFIHSDDGAWDYAMFPAEPDDFFKWYFKPELALNEDDRDFSRRCINLLSTELDTE